LYNETIYPHAPQKGDYGDEKIRSMVNSYKIDAISIGNGTASETEFFIKKIAFDKPIQILLFQKPELQCIQHLKLREEFPNYDVTVRGSISIGDDCQILWLNWLKLIQKLLAYQ
jgi:uncharacterized protein